MSGETTKARELYDALHVAERLRGQMYETLIVIAGANIDNPETWPCGDVSYDDYDGSFEFHDTRDDFLPTSAMVKVWRALGFDRCWINYPDATEIYCDFHVPIWNVGKRKLKAGVAAVTPPTNSQPEPAAPPASPERDET
jgi:hypothetical protein